MSEENKEQRRFSGADIKKNKDIAAISYLFLFFLPLISSPDSKFAKFHANQSLILLIVCAAGNILLSIIANILLSWRTWWIYSTIATVWNILILVLIWKGFSAAREGKVERLPIIGKLNINIIK